MKKRSKSHRENFELDYNERADGYGAGPSESVHHKYPYERERQRQPEQSRDRTSLSNPYGEMDQYSFRGNDLATRRHPRSPGLDDEWRDWDRPVGQRYDSDDHSRFAGPDFRDQGQEYDEEVERHRSRPQYPGVSGKTLRGNTWFNRDRYEEQRRFIGKGPKGYRRSDDRIYEEVCEVLLHSPDIDASKVGVKIRDGHVYLEGEVESRREKHLAEYLIEDLPGVLDIHNELKTMGRERREGPAGAAKKDLGINDESSEYR